MRQNTDDAEVLNLRRKIEEEQNGFEDASMYRQDAGEDGVAYIIVPNKSPQKMQAEISQLAIKVRRKARKITD